MSDTPRTDAASTELIHAFSHERIDYVTSDFARELERENATLRARLSEVERERDEAREREAKYFRELTTIKADAQGHNAAINLAERDQLRADNARLREVLEDIERCSGLTSEGSWCRQRARAALAKTENKQ